MKQDYSTGQDVSNQHNVRQAEHHSNTLLSDADCDKCSNFTGQ